MPVSGSSSGSYLDRYLQSVCKGIIARTLRSTVATLQDTAARDKMNITNRKAARTFYVVESAGELSKLEKSSLIPAKTNPMNMEYGCITMVPLTVLSS